MLEDNIKGRGPVKGYDFVQVHKNGRYYIYKQMDGDRFVAYEVFRAKIRDGEHQYPTQTEWGLNAWTIKDYDRAWAKLQELINR